MDSEQFIAQVRNLVQSSDDDEDLTGEFILRQAHLGLMERFTQPVIMTRSGSLLHRQEVTLVPGQSMYRIPSRSITQGLERFEVAINTGNTALWRPLNVLTNFQSVDYSGTGQRGAPVAFAYATDCVEVFPTPSTNWTARFWYYLRPSRLVLPSEDSILLDITSMGGSTYHLTLSTTPVNGLLDVQHSTGNCEVIVAGLSFTEVSPGVLAVQLNQNQAAQISAIETCVFPADTTAFIQLPQEMANALVSYVGAVCLAEKGDAEKAEIFNQKCSTAIKNLIDIQMPRSKSQPYLFRTRSTYLRRNLGRGGW